MYHFKHIIVSTAVALVLLLPGQADAQSTEQAHQELLREIIVLLEQKLTWLLEQRELARTGSDLQFAGTGQVVASYQYRTPASLGAVTDARHRAFFARAVELAPAELEDTLAYLVVYTADNSSDAYVDASGDNTGAFAWRLGVNDDYLAQSTTDEEIDELIVHELGHIVAFQQGLDLSDTVTCHPVVEEDGFCPNPNSYYGQFVTTFWNDELLDQLAIGGEEFELISVPGYGPWFVSDYASTDPHEDFAESFAYFVLYENTGYGQIASEKINFFNRFSGTRRIASEIQSKI